MNITSVGPGTATLTVTAGINTATIKVTVAADGTITIDSITKYDPSAAGADVVSAQIAALSPGPVTPADVQAARAAFANLSPADQALVTNVADLETAEESATKVAADKATVDVTYATGETSTTVKSDVTLVSAVTQGSTVAWASSNSAIATDGTATRQIYSDGDATATVTATITHGTVQDTKEFTVKVLKKNFTVTTPSTKDNTFTIVPDGYELADFAVVIDSIQIRQDGLRDGVQFEVSYDVTTGVATVTAVSGAMQTLTEANLGIDIKKDGKDVIKYINLLKGSSDGSYNNITFTVKDEI